ncbi:MAG: AAA family ATPase [Opitutaceae bacterium]
MSFPRAVERAKSYLNVHIGRPDAVAAGIHTRAHEPFITISRECGTGGTAFAQHLADRLNLDRRDEEPAWTVFDQHIVEHVLRDAQLSPRLARFLPEDRIPEITGAVGEIVGLHPNLWELVQKTNKFVRALAGGGHVILVGRGANFATAGLGGGLHIRLVAPEDERVRRMAQRESIDMTTARALVRKTASARAHYVRSVFERNIGESAAYDLILNVARLPEAACIDMIEGALKMIPASVTAGAPIPARSDST